MQPNLRSSSRLFSELLSSLPVGLVLVGLLLAAPGLADGIAWPGFRGPADAHAIDLPDTFGFTVDWTRDLGSGYSSLAVAGGKVIVPFTDGDHDVLAAFDAESGDEVWKLVLAEKYVGHDGSDDGPLATPAVVGNRVYFLGPKGQFVAADLETGAEHWRVQLDESNSTEPFYGYTSSPIPAGDVVVLVTGGEGTAITAFDAESGEVRWRAGDDSAQYQSAAFLTLAGREQIVAPTDQWVHGLDPATGSVLWSHRHSEGETKEGSAHVTAASEDRFFLSLRNQSAMLALRTDGDGFGVEELWSGRPLSGSLVLPVYHDGHLYGFTGRIFSAVDAATGELVWRTRDVAGNNLSLIGDRLVALTADGELVVAEARADAYTETNRVAVFEAGDYADPAWADGRVFLRNLTHLGSVVVDADKAPATTEDEGEEMPRHLGELGAFVKKVEAMPEAERQAAVDSYFANLGDATPIVEGPYAHFVHRGAQEDVGLSGTVFGWSDEERSFYRVPGTDLAYYSLELDPKAAYDYQVSIDFAPAGPDPGNPLVEDMGWGRRSILRMGEWEASAASDEPADGTPRGQLDRFQFRVEGLDAREIQVWTPPGYAGGDASYPLLVVNHGDQALRNGLFANILDNLVAGDTIATPVAVFVPRAARAEYGGELAGDYARLLAEEIVPHVRRHYRIDPEASTAVLGVGSAANVSLQASLEHAGTFDRVGLLSFYVTYADRESFWRLVETTKAEPELIRVETGPNDYDIAGAGIDSETSSKTLASKLEAAGLPVDLVVHHGTAGWGTWRDRAEPVLEAILPPIEE